MPFGVKLSNFHAWVGKWPMWMLINYYSYLCINIDKYLKKIDFEEISVEEKKKWTRRGRKLSANSITCCGARSRNKFPPRLLIVEVCINHTFNFTCFMCFFARFLYKMNKWTLWCDSDMIMCYLISRWNKVLIFNWCNWYVCIWFWNYLNHWIKEDCHVLGLISMAMDLRVMYTMAMDFRVMYMYTMAMEPTGHIYNDNGPSSHIYIYKGNETYGSIYTMESQTDTRLDLSHNNKLK